MERDADPREPPSPDGAGLGSPLWAGAGAVSGVVALGVLGEPDAPGVVAGPVGAPPVGVPLIGAAPVAPLPDGFGTPGRIHRPTATLGPADPRVRARATAAASAGLWPLTPAPRPPARRYPSPPRAPPRP